jgi:hypothetical protein
LIPLFLVLYPAAGLGPDAATDPTALLRVFARTPALFVGPSIIEVAGHVIGAAAILATWFRWGRESFLATIATLAGLAWMTIDTVDNAMSIQIVPALATAFAGGDASAATTFNIVGRLTDALRLAGHLCGGLWVVGIAAFTQRGRLVHPIVAWLGVATGIVLALNPFVPALLNVSFMTLPAWLVAFGAVLSRSRAGAAAPEGARIRASQASA